MENPASPKLKRDTIEGKARDGEPLGYKEYLLISQTKETLALYRKGYDQINWQKED